MIRRLHTALFFLGVAFLAYLIWAVGVRELWEQLKALRWGLVPFILSEGVANLMHTAGWRRCLVGSRKPVRFLSLFRMALAGFAINYLTPSASLGGEVTKAGLLASDRRGADAVTSVVVDKFCVAFSYLLLILPATLIVLLTFELPLALRAAIVVSTLVLTGGIFGFMLVQKHGKLGAAVGWLATWRVGRLALQKTAEDLSAVDEGLKAFHRERPRDLFLAVTWHFFGHSVNLVQTGLFFMLLATPVGLAKVVGASLLCLWFDLFIFAVPGSLEGSRIIALKEVGLTTVQGVTCGLALRMAQLFWAVLGLVGYGCYIRSEAGSKVPAPAIAAASKLSPEPELNPITTERPLF